VVADVDRDHGGLTARSVAEALTPATKAVVAVHLGGWPCEIEAISALCEERGLALVEDCAQALGATVAGRKVGTFGDAGCFSFCQDKIMTTGGEGGMLVTGSASLARAAWSYKDHGKDPEAARKLEPGVAFKWVHDSFGSNLRMTEVQAAIGRVALRETDGWIGLRRRNAAILSAGMSGMPGLRVPVPGSGIDPVWYRFTAYVMPERLLPGWSRDRVAGEITAAGVPCYSGPCPEIHLEKAFDVYGERGPVPDARELGETSLTFLVHHRLEERHMEQTIGTVAEVMEAATGLDSGA
jgi:dTDP-4-amino-4,6-dideoxygalactose transaminase